MGVTLNVELLPFQVPNFVIQKVDARPREEGFTPGPKYRLADVDAETLSRLCDDFRAAVFEKADKIDPRLDPNYPSRRGS